MDARLDARALTRELLAFDTINPPGLERACAPRLGALLEAGGFRLARQADETLHGNVGFEGETESQGNLSGSVPPAGGRGGILA